MRLSGAGGPCRSGQDCFLAWLVKERNYIHHFAELAPGQEGIETGLKNLAAQIILAYKLNADEAIPDAIPDVAGRPEELSTGLRSLAKGEASPGEEQIDRHWIWISFQKGCMSIMQVTGLDGAKPINDMDSCQRDFLGARQYMAQPIYWRWNCKYSSWSARKCLNTCS